MINQLTNATDPATPVWADLFRVDYDGQTIDPIAGTHEYTGSFYYDFTDAKKPLNRVDLDNGRWETFCGVTHHLED